MKYVDQWNTYDDEKREQIVVISLLCSLQIINITLQNTYLALREKMVVVFLKIKLQWKWFQQCKPTIEPVLVTLPVRYDDVAKFLHHHWCTAGHQTQSSIIIGLGEIMNFSKPTVWIWRHIITVPSITPLNHTRFRKLCHVMYTHRSRTRAWIK